MTKAKPVPPRRPGTPKNVNKLTDLERAFCLHYVGAARGVGAHAMKMAGYDGKSDVNFRRYAYTVLQRPKVIAEIDRLRQAREVRLSITADEVLLDLVAVRDKARLLPATSANLKVELAAVERIGDHVDVMAFRKQLGLANPTGGPIQHEDLSKLSDEELQAIAVARAIIDRAAGLDPDPEPGSDPTGA